MLENAHIVCASSISTGKVSLTSHIRFVATPSLLELSMLHLWRPCELWHRSLLQSLCILPNKLAQEVFFLELTLCLTSLLYLPSIDSWDWRMDEFWGQVLFLSQRVDTRHVWLISTLISGLIKELAWVAWACIHQGAVSGRFLNWLVEMMPIVVCATAHLVLLDELKPQYWWEKSWLKHRHGLDWHLFLYRGLERAWRLKLINLIRRHNAWILNESRQTRWLEWIYNSLAHGIWHHHWRCWIELLTLQQRRRLIL